MNENRKPDMTRHPLRTALIFAGIAMLLASGSYLIAGLVGLVPLQAEVVSWNNIRIVSGFSILGCLMAAVGYGNE